jgi:hypothetical protein
LKTAHFISKDLTTSQNLALAPLDYTFDFGQKRKVEQIMFKASQAISETITITLDSAHGANYDVILQEVVLVAESSFIWRPQGECNLHKEDKIRIQCTNANGLGVIYCIVKSSEM